MQDKIIFARTFDFDVDNTSDHQPVIMKLKYHSNGVQLSADRDSVSNLKQKINWSKFNQAFIRANYVAPLLSEIALLNPVDLNHSDKLSEFITTIILKSSLSLLPLVQLALKNANMVSMLSYLLMSKSHAHFAQVLLNPGNKLTLSQVALNMFSM